MHRITKATIAGAVAVIAVGTGAGMAVAGGGGDSGGAITGAALGKARAAALAHTGGGRVTGTEVGDEESYYEVEVMMGGGRRVDVQLDKSFNVVKSTTDHEDSGREDSDDRGESGGADD